MTLAIDQRLVREIIAPTSSGMTQPYLCRLSDDQLYAVKGKRAQAHGLLAEVYAAVLGQALGLPIPDYVLADIPRALIDHATDPDIAGLGTGTAFASRWQEQMTPLTRSAFRKVDQHQLSRIYLFDHWIANGDRSLTDHGGNPNLFIRSPDDSLIVIDHNLAFSPYDPGQLRLHACRDAWLAVGAAQRPSLEQDMPLAKRAIDDLPTLLPYAWLDEEPDFHERVLATLSRAQQPEFWEELG